VNPLAKLLEAALFASPRPIATDELAALDPEASPAALQSALDELREHYDVDGHGVALVEVGGGWQVLTRPEYTEAIERAQMAVRPTKLSPAALEVATVVKLIRNALMAPNTNTPGIQKKIAGMTTSLSRSRT